MATQKKIETVEKLTDRLSRAKAVVLTDYHGLTHRQMEELKKAVKKAGGDFIVAKNTLLKLAAGKTNRPQITTLTDNLSGPTALLLSYQDVLLPLKEVAGFMKKFQLPIIKVGILEGRLLTGEELVVISLLPDKEALLGRVVGQINSPLWRLHRALTWNVQRLALTLKAVEKTKVR